MIQLDEKLGELIIDRIVSVAHPEKIILFGHFRLGMIEIIPVTQMNLNLHA